MRTKRQAVWLGALALVAASIPAGGIAAGASDPPIPAPTIAHPLPHVQALFDSYVAKDEMPGIVGAFGVGDLPTVFISDGQISDDPGAPAAVVEAEGCRVGRARVCAAVPDVALVEPVVVGGEHGRAGRGLGGARCGGLVSGGPR